MIIRQLNGNRSERLTDSFRAPFHRRLFPFPLTMEDFRAVILCFVVSVDQRKIFPARRVHGRRGIHHADILTGKGQRRHSGQGLKTFQGNNGPTVKSRIPWNNDELFHVFAIRSSFRYERTTIFVAINFRRSNMSRAQTCAKTSDVAAM